MCLQVVEKVLIWNRYFLKQQSYYPDGVELSGVRNAGQQLFPEIVALLRIQVK